MKPDLLEKLPATAPEADKKIENRARAAEDLLLVNRALKDDSGAYDELIRRYQERIYATIYHMTSNHEDANDITQETFIKAYRALISFKLM